MAIEKIKIVGSVLELQLAALAIQPIWPIFAVNRLKWQCCLASSSKTAPRLLIFFSIAMGADYSFEVKNIEVWVPAFFKHNDILSVATVNQRNS